MHQIVQRLRLRPRPYWGAHRAPPKPLAGKREEERRGRGGEGKEGNRKGEREEVASS